MGADYITLDEAVQLSGLHPNTLRRLLREGVLQGFKTAHAGKQHWLVSVVSLKQYTDPVNGFLLDLPGPKLFLRRVESEVDETGKDEDGTLEQL